MNSAVIEQIWVQGDLLTHIVMLTLLLMSVLTWSVLLLKGVQLFRLARLIRLSRLHDRPPAVLSGSFVDAVFW